MADYTKKIIDNLNISITNLHIRIENEDLEDAEKSFSLGVCLGAMTFNTTDSKWMK